MTKQFKPCDEDYDYVCSSLLEDERVTEDRMAILAYIFKKHPKIFWEAYKNL